MTVLGAPTEETETLGFWIQAYLTAAVPRALSEAQVRSVKNVLDRLGALRRLMGGRHRGGDTPPATHRHTRPYRDRAIVHVLPATGLRRAELDPAQLEPNTQPSCAGSARPA
ncbi:MAG: hypothetical protein ACRDRI_19490 [Pseudonocardiaceae bacterium]